MKKLLLILFCLPMTVSSQNNGLLGYTYFAEILIPEVEKEKYTFITSIHITHDEKYLAIEMNFKPTYISYYNFKTLEFLGLVEVPGWVYSLGYNKKCFILDRGAKFLGFGQKYGILDLETHEIKNVGDIPNGYKKAIELKEKTSFYKDYAFSRKSGSDILTIFKYKHDLTTTIAENIELIDNEYSEPESIIETGDYYALIVAAENYEDKNIKSLDNPISDAEDFYDVLINNYTFSEENVRIIKDASKDDILKELDYFSHLVGSDDNFLIFYAGHGYWDEQFKQGYWLTVDSRKDAKRTWLSNSIIQDYLRGISARNTLLIADACFGGSIFKTRNAFKNNSLAMQELYYTPSCKVMTSGAMTEVPDKSVFLEYLVKRLDENTNRYLTSEALFSSFKIAVINNSANQQIPQFGVVRETGDEGGDFIFIKK